MPAPLPTVGRAFAVGCTIRPMLDVKVIHIGKIEQLTGPGTLEVGTEIVSRVWRGVEDSPGWTYVHFIARPDIGRRDPVRGRWAGGAGVRGSRQRAARRLEQRFQAGGPETAEENPVKYTVIVEKGESSYGAFVPDLPGCISVGEDREQTLRSIEEAVAFHVEGLRAEGLPVPPPQCDIVQVEVDVA